MSGADSMEPGEMSRALAELEAASLRMEALGPADLEEAARLLARAAELRRGLDAPLARLRAMARTAHPESRQDS